MEELDNKRYTKKSAHISDDGLYRYTLTRVWDENKPKVLFIGLNPSIADANIDDRTIMKCHALVKNWDHIKFQSALGYGGFIMDNLFAFRSTKPKLLKCAHEPIGSENDSQLMRDALVAKLIILAWSCHGRFKGRGQQVLQDLMNLGVKEKLYFLRKTTSNMPYHPLGGRTADTIIPNNIIPLKVKDDSFSQTPRSRYRKKEVPSSKSWNTQESSGTPDILISSTLHEADISSPSSKLPLPSKENNVHHNYYGRFRYNPSSFQNHSFYPLTQYCSPPVNQFYISSYALTDFSTYYNIIPENYASSNNHPFLSHSFSHHQISLPQYSMENQYMYVNPYTNHS